MLSIDQLLTQHQFTKPIFEGINKYIQDGGLLNARELHYFLPKLLTRAFGGPDTSGWIDTLGGRKDDGTSSLYTLFHPCSPFFQTLLSHAHVQDSVYEIQLDKLPAPFQNAVLSGDILSLPQFFQSRIVFPQFKPTAMPRSKFHDKIISGFGERNDIHLKLSMIEYYFFYLIYAWIFIKDRYIALVAEKKSIQMNQPIVPGSAVANMTTATMAPFDPTPFYCSIIESYLYFLLPLQSSSSSIDSRFANNSFHSLTDSIFTSSAIHISGAIDSRNIIAASLSDAFISMISELWLHQNEYGCQKKSSGQTTTGVVYPSPSLPMTRAVLVVVQHLAIIGLFETDSSQKGRPHTTFVSTLKSKTYQTLRKPVYYFIHDALCKPSYSLDSQLVLNVLDIWLAYIQPWRIQKKFFTVISGQPSSSIPLYEKISKEWLFFIAENLLFYTELLRIYLSYCHRNAVTLFFTDPRISLHIDQDIGYIQKVLSVFDRTEHLQSVLKNGESLLVKSFSNSSSSSLFYSHPYSYSSSSVTSSSSSSSLLNPYASSNEMHHAEPSFYDKPADYLPAMKACLMELLGDAELPCPLFQSLTMIKELIAKLHSALLLLSEEKPDAEEHRLWSSVSKRVKAWFPIIDQATGQVQKSRQKRLQSLEYVKETLVDFFELSIDDITIDGIPLSAVAASRVRRGVSIFAETEDPQHLQLSETAKQQIKMGTKKCTNRDIDTRYFVASNAVRSDELPILVMLLSTLSNVVNEIYGQEIIPYLTEKGYRIPSWVTQFRFNLRWFAAIPNMTLTLLCFLSFYIYMVYC